MFDKSIALDTDIIHALKRGETLLKRTKTPPSFAVGDVVTVKETWGVDALTRRPLLKADVNPGDHFVVWYYSNRMPLELAKRFLKVIGVAKMPMAEYEKICGREIVYNRLYFAMAESDLPFHRWFRDGKIPYKGKSEDVYVVVMKLREFADEGAGELSESAS